MGEHRCSPTVKEVQDTIVHPLQSHAKLVYAIPENVGFRPAEFMPEIPKPFDPYLAFVLSLGRKSVEPFE